MNLTLLKLIYRAFLLVVLSFTYVFGLMAQEIDENYIFYSPSNSQMGLLSFISKEHYIFTNNESILLMKSEENTHLDTLDLEPLGFRGLTEYVIVIDENTFALGSYNSYALINISSDTLKVTRHLSRKELQKKNIKANMYVLLPEGLFTYDIKRKQKKFTYTMKYYNRNFKLIQQNKIEVGEANENDLSSWAIIYPHHINIQNELICLSLKGYDSYVRFNSETGEIGRIDMNSFIQEEEAADIFYDPIKDKNYLLKYAPAESGQTRMSIYKLDLQNDAKYKLNEGILELKKIRGGIYNNKLMLMDDFKGSLGFYLIPIDELHKL